MRTLRAEIERFLLRSSQKCKVSVTSTLSLCVWMRLSPGTMIISRPTLSYLLLSSQTKSSVKTLWSATRTGTTTHQTKPISSSFHRMRSLSKPSPTSNPGSKCPSHSNSSSSLTIHSSMSLSMTLSLWPLAQPLMRTLRDWKPCCSTPLPLIAPGTPSIWASWPRASRNWFILLNLSTSLWSKLLSLARRRATKRSRRRRTRRRAKDSFKSSLSRRDKIIKATLMIKQQRDKNRSPSRTWSKRMINKPSKKLIKDFQKKNLGPEKICVRLP